MDYTPAPRRTRRALLLGVLALGAVGFVRAPQSDEPALRSDTAHVLNYPNGSWPQTFDPANATDTGSFQVLSMLYANLVKLDTQNRIVPDLATSWTVRADGRVYTFHLRPDAHFSDGSPITADDVIFSLDRALNPKAYLGKNPSPVALTYLGHIVGASSYQGTGDVAGLKKIAADTVQITLDRPIAFFLPALAYYTGDVLKRGTPIGGLTTQNPRAHQVSSGAWTIATVGYRTELTFAPNPGYYGYRRMRLRRVEMPVVTSAADSGYQGYESGQFAMAGVPTSRLATSRALPDFHRSVSLAISYIVYNVTKPPFDNKDLRLATSYAINRDLINDTLLHGAQQTMYSIVPQSLAGYDAAGKPFVPHYDPVKARLYLARARTEMGHAFPASLTIKYVGTPDNTKMYTELQYQWKQIGLTVKLQALDFNTWLGLAVKPTTSLAYKGGEAWLEAGWVADYPDAQDFTTNLLAPSSPYNVGNYHNPRFEALLAEALTAHGTKRAALYITASRIALNDVAWTMLGQNTASWRWRHNISGLTLWSGAAYPVPTNNDWTTVDVH